MLWYHDPRDPIGIVNDASADSKGLNIRGQLDLNVKSAQEKYSLMKLKAIRGLSFGYRTIKHRWNNGVKSLTEINLFEFSPCTFQMHPDALISSVKSLEEVIEFLENFKPTEENSEAFNSAVKSLNDTLKRLEPPNGTPTSKKSLYAPIIEALGQSKPQLHLLDPIVKALEKSLK